ncbi:MAG: O-antigen ligase family protein [Hyphomicrobiales bacterium]|nr:O-antigen ligase family protein [Hyphomicrobiales bacterium]
MAAIHAAADAAPHLRRRSVAHALSLAFVWLAVASSAIVFTEPAPVDALVAGLLILLPVVGLMRFTPGLVALFGGWLALGGLAFLATLGAELPERAMVHASVTVFLAFTFLLFAGFVMRNAHLHASLMMHAMVTAALIASIAALVGYFGLLPGAEELFTKFGRASATFKDPNVFGAFLVLPAAWLTHEIVTRPPARGLLLAPIVALIVIAVLLSFSRGAWLNLAIAIGIVSYLAFLTARTEWKRWYVVAMALVAAVAALAVLGAASRIDKVEELLHSRAALDQSYDMGPEGRFGGQAKAAQLILDNPLGIGPQQFAPLHHIEEPHNVYLALFLNSGWLGGFLFIALLLTTAFMGLAHCFRQTSTQGIFIATYATFLAHLVEGFVIDLDHWRHFFLIMAMIWGLILAEPVRLHRTGHGLPKPGPLPPYLGPSRPPRLLVPAAPKLVYALPPPRRERGREDSRPSRVAGRTFSHNRA